MQNERQDSAVPHGVIHANLPTQPLSGALSQTPDSTAAKSKHVDSNQARKVAEVFLTAGHAFQKLGDLAMQLHMGASSLPSEQRWSENNVEQLREALTRFAHELDQISNNVQAKTTKMISTDIRRRHLMPQRQAMQTISTLKRQPSKLDPAVVPKRLNFAKNSRQYIAPTHVAVDSAAPQVMPTTRTYQVTRAGTSALPGQRQYVMSMPQAGPSRVIPVITQRISSQPAAVHLQNANIISHQGPPTVVPVLIDSTTPRLDQRI
ncbi:hypothetical protein DICVIV_11940 [Dictyocaulus viviparus]|uniref:Uncharacterized protein n=1 Tax=Dictyocaulus viviparus TaxID=29172 RepID=A0A0D8XE94_DICVI|nr:hypothetical protein DICVIV_11940 [Dictyocaulus viviparus]